METQGFGLTSLIHTFPSHSIFSALQPSLGTEDSQGNELGMKAKLARGWALFALHAQSWMCIPTAAASVTAGCNHQVKQSLGRNRGLPQKTHRCMPGMLRVLLRDQAALTHPSLSASKLTY